MTFREVWVVSSGEYSDYSVDVAFASEELARAALAIHEDRGEAGAYGVAQVERLPFFDQPPTMALRRTFSAYRSGWDSEKREYVGGSFESRDDGEEEIAEWRLSGSGGPCNTIVYRPDAGHGLRVFVEGTDFERVRKVASDMRARIMACPWLSLTEGEIAEAIEGVHFEDVRW